MHISDIEIITASVLLVSLVKGLWDTLVLPKWKAFELRNSNRQDHNDIIKIFRTRDDVADKLAFVLITSLTVWILAMGFTQDEVTLEKFDLSSRRVDAIDRRVSSLEDFAKLYPKSTVGLNLGERTHKGDLSCPKSLTN